jgi:hypothetical protein
VARGPYGLERVAAGVYLHPRSGRYILRTEGWEGPNGGRYDRWEPADWRGGWEVGADAPFRTLRACAAHLDRAERP